MLPFQERSQQMLVVREHFVAKPGQASKLANVMKEAMKAVGNNRCRIMTDLTGAFNHVVMETDFDDLTSMEKRMEEYGKNEILREKMKGYTDLYITGGREIYRVVS
jgi:hypothetical protein